MFFRYNVIAIAKDMKAAHSILHFLATTAHYIDTTLLLARLIICQSM